MGIGLINHVSNIQLERNLVAWSIKIIVFHNIFEWNTNENPSISLRIIVKREARSFENQNVIRC